MNPRATILAVTLFLAACGDAVHQEAAAPVSMRMAAPAPAAMNAAVAEGGTVQAALDAATPRYLAERQFWVFELPETAIETRWQAHIALCRQDCEVLHAALSKSAHSPVSAALQLRVGRANAEKLLGAMSAPEVKERRVEREDKTLQVVDVEARLKTLGDLRDRLRELLAKRAGSLKDILETERELARVQGELDAMAAQRKALANETEKILLHVDYRPEPSLGETGAMQPLVEAWRGAGRAFASSLAAALLFIVQALPWLVIVVPVLWGVWKGLRRLADWRRARRAARESA
ncbi:MAG: DUF4349 domain-containing protein [Betaproteobacteria bacterium]|nr:DUF4349 domain-containing protein [Betaproteobacteria bacterium]